MKFYRYEKPDGGGPYFTKDGISRTDNALIFEDDTLDGCLTIEELKKWFLGKENVLQDCSIHLYDGELLNYNSCTKNAVFRKSTAQKLD